MNVASSRIEMARESAAEEVIAPGAVVAPTAYVFGPELIALQPPSGRAAAALEMLRIEIFNDIVRVGRRGLAVCGATSGVGVTFTATNLAVAMSKAGISTLLVDGNLHRPAVQRLIMPPASALGLSDFLRSENISASDIIQEDVLADLSVIFAGEPCADAAEQMAGGRFRELIVNCQRDYALTIVDTPAAARWAEARTISNLTGYALLVARRDLSYVDDMVTLGRELVEDGVKVVGNVMNAA